MRSLLLALTLAASACRSAPSLYKNPDAPLDRRVDDLLSRLTLDEKVAQLTDDAPAVERLGIPRHEWWNECLHGAAGDGVATVFPQSIALAATWNPSLIGRVAEAIADEARARHHQALRDGKMKRGYGLTMFSPNINIFRDPRWGRGQETYGEDPYLTGRIAVAYVRGLQGSDPRYWKVVATPKHFVAHSGPERIRHHFDARVSPRDLEETYMPAFRAAIVEGGAGSLMCAYNRVNGEPACASRMLLQNRLRDEWGFTGYVVSDCHAIEDIFKQHRVAKDVADASAQALQAGCDLSCGPDFGSLGDARKNGRVQEAEIDNALRRLFRARFRLGQFDPPEQVPFARIPISVVASPAHLQLAREAARQGIVLLKNEGGHLPISKQVRSIAVIGPNADNPDALLGNYAANPSRIRTPWQALKDRLGSNVRLRYAPGMRALTEIDMKLQREATSAARESELAIVVLGLSPALEGEEKREEVRPGFSSGDRTTLTLPPAQEELLKAVHATGTPVVLVLMSGSALGVSWAADHVPAIVQAWYPGQEGGEALVDVLLGDHNPAGRLPVTFYRSVEDLPHFEDYSMRNRTYRFFSGTPLYPFGHGLSYTKFRYEKLEHPHRVAPGAFIEIGVDVLNAGARDGEEVVQLYVASEGAPDRSPRRSLQGVARIQLRMGERRRVLFRLNPDQWSRVEESGRRVQPTGTIRVEVGGRQSGNGELVEAGGAQVLTSYFVVEGKK